MKDQNATTLNVEMHRAVAVAAAGGIPIQIDIQTNMLDEIHVQSLSALRFTWAINVATATTNLADADLSCATVAGGEMTFHVRKMREIQLMDLWITTDVAGADTLTWWGGWYQG